MSIRTRVWGAACAAAMMCVTVSASADEAVRVSDTADSTAHQPGASPRMVAGVTLMASGGLALAGGTVSYFALSAATDAGGDDPYKGAKTASIVAMVLGGAGLAAGLPLVLTADDDDVAVESDRKQSQHRSASLAPTVSLGIGAAAATWTF